MVKGKESIYVTFYNECVQNGILDFNSERNIEKAKLIAKKYRLTGSVSFLYQRGYAELEKMKRDLDESNRIKNETAKKNNDKERYEKSIKYSDLKGISKPIKELQDELQPLLKQYREKSAELGVSLQEKEKDWAILGGIASGLAGGAAGLAVALDAQRENAEIRERNKKIVLAEAYWKNKIIDDLKRIESQINNIKYEIERYQTKLISKENEDQVFDNLIIKDTTFQITNAKSIIITTNVAVKDSYVIYDTIKPNVDGTLYATIFYNDNFIGVADLVLPKKGIKSDFVEISGISLFLFEGQIFAKNKINITIGPKYLWAIE